MRTCGIDQSYSKTAIVILLEGELEKFEVFSSNKEDDIFYRCFDLTNKISEYIVMIQPEKIAIEGLSFGSRGDQTRNLGGLQFSVVSRLKYVNNFKHVNIVAPTTLKKFGTGYGKAKKEEMIEALPEHIRDIFTDAGFKKSNGLDDLADAYWLAKYLEKR